MEDTVHAVLGEDPITLKMTFIVRGLGNNFEMFYMTIIEVGFVFKTFVTRIRSY